jgi:catechol-2,3-dioxygenase
VEGDLGAQQKPLPHSAASPATSRQLLGDGRRALELFGQELETERTPVLYEAERRFTRSLQVLDPDGNEIELYVEVSET